MNAATALILEQFADKNIDEKWFERCFDRWEGQEPSWDMKQEATAHIEDLLTQEIASDASVVFEALNASVFDLVGPELRHALESLLDDVDWHIVADRITDAAAWHMGQNHAKNVMSCTDVFNDFYYGH